jgi:hypothetical protein
MAFYELFLVRDGETVGDVKRHLSDDLDALEAARTLCRDCDVEVYENLRLVARVKRDDAPLNVGDRALPRACADESMPTERAVSDFLDSGGQVKILPATITVAGREVVDYLRGCGVEAKLRASHSATTYFCNGKPLSLRKLVDIANAHRLEKQLPPFAVKV